MRKSFNPTLVHYWWNFSLDLEQGGPTRLSRTLFNMHGPISKRCFLVAHMAAVLQTIDFVLMDDFVAHFYPIAKSVVYDRLMSLDEEELEESFNDRTSLLEVFVVR